jgi:CheY-like chemotaxis protein
VVEDEVLVAATIECELAVAGAEVVGPAYTVDEALALAAADEIHVAVLDINLLGKKVWPVAETLHQRRIPYVFASANALGPDAIPEPFAAAPRFDKPVHIGAMLRALEQLAA